MSKPITLRECAADELPRSVTSASIPPSSLADPEIRRVRGLVEMLGVALNLNEFGAR